MSADWIKMRANLWDDPRVTALVDATDTCEAQVVGGLYWLWATADQHTEDGLLLGMSTRQIDRKTGISGFGDALIAIGWITELQGAIQVTRFDEHNGTSAKRRASESRRKMSARDADKVRTDKGHAAHLEKERDKDIKQEQKQQHVQPAAAPSRFAEFWAEYPNKKGRQEAEKTWVKRKLDHLCDDLIAHVRLMSAADDAWLRGFIPMGSTYLNQGRWEDIPKQQPRAGPVVPQPVGKQMQGVMTLEGMIRERMAGNRNSEGATATGLLVAGPDSCG